MSAADGIFIFFVSLLSVTKKTSYRKDLVETSDVCDLQKVYWLDFRVYLGIRAKTFSTVRRVTAEKTGSLTNL